MEGLDGWNVELGREECSTVARKAFNYLGRCDFISPVSFGGLALKYLHVTEPLRIIYAFSVSRTSPAAGPSPSSSIA